MSTEWGICLSSTRIDEKSNEIPEMQDIMGKLDCQGCVVTADAMNTQKETARAIIKEAHADYCLALKENQKTAYHEVKEYFASEELLKESMAVDGQYLKATEKTASSTVIREYFITDDIKWFEDRKDWEKLGSIGYERRTITRKGTDETIMEERYFLCSMKPIAELFAIVARRHWHIENNLHWVLHIVFREDQLRSKEKNGIHNLSLIRRFVLFIYNVINYCSQTQVINNHLWNCSYPQSINFCTAS